MPPGWGTWYRSQAASIPSCRVEAGAVRQPVDFRRERGPVGGRGGGVPRQPLPGTREAWPQRVGWLLHRKVLRASPADAAEAAGEGFGCDPSR